MAAPIVPDGTSFVDQNGWVRASSIFTVTDPDGDPITTYQFIDTTTVAGTSYIWVNGTTPSSGFGPPFNPITVSAADLANVWLHGGATIGGIDGLQVRASDDNLVHASTWGIITLVTQAPSVGANIIRGGSGDDALLSGTPGDDQIFGNDGNDLLNGVAGNDFLDGGNGLDTARFSGLMSSYTITRAGTSGTVTGPDGTDSFSSVERLQFGDNTLALVVPKNDFGGDGKSDILWHNTNGQVALWQMNDHTLAQGGYINGGSAVPTDWQIAGVGDFGGDGKSDVLWHNTSGQVSMWEMNGNTLAQGGYINGGSAVSTDWQIAGVGDFGGDGKSDILWHSANGQLSMWEMNGHTLAQGGYLNGGNVVPSDWQIAGVGDFGGDGKSDILWRNTNGQLSMWEMDGHTLAQGGYINGGSAVPTDWQIAGVGDFGGDGKSDILWRNTNGQLSMWEMDGLTLAQGGYINGGNAISTDWHVANVGDFNGDGKSDILWRNDSGALAEWDMNGHAIIQGGYVNNGTPVTSDWIVNAT